jgi:hypothetical protein
MAALTAIAQAVAEADSHFPAFKLGVGLEVLAWCGRLGEDLRVPVPAHHHC